MERFQPKSVLHLVIIGFLLVLFPITFAIISASTSLDQLVDEHQDTVIEVVELSRNSNKIQENIHDMERVARQYQVLKEEVLITVYQKYFDTLKRSLGNIKRFFPESDVNATIKPLEFNCEMILNAMKNYSKDEDSLVRSLPLFVDMQHVAGRIIKKSQYLVDKKVTDSEKAARDSKRLLLIQGSILIPATVILIALVVFLITKPLGQLDRAIRSIGDRDNNTAIKVTGTRDLRRLGDRLRWLRDKLNDLEEQKHRFLRHMSHELKTPLANLKEGIDLLIDEIPGPLNKSQKEVVTIIKDNAHLFQRLIENLLDYNLISSNSKLFLNEVHFSQFISEIVDTHKLSIKSKNLLFKLTGEPIKICFDASKIRAAIDNLVSNAVNFSPKKGAVFIEWKVTKGKFKLVITDEGPGVKKEEKKMIFSPFYQGKTKNSGVLKGSGIGLSVASECIQAHKGKLELVDTKGRGGAKFQITIPLLGATT